MSSMLAAINKVLVLGMWGTRIQMGNDPEMALLFLEELQQDGYKVVPNNWQECNCKEGCECNDSR